MTSPNCRLFLVAPGSGDADLLADCLSAALAAGDVASLVVACAPDAGSAQRVARQLLPIAQAENVAVLMENDCDLAVQLKADGVQITADLAACKSTRSILGPDMVIGANCASDRHKAMEMAEAGADYVCLDPFSPGPGDEAVISWWAQLFEIPCVSAPPLEPDEMAGVVRMGADFVRPSDNMWSSPQAAAEIIKQSLQAIASADR